MKIIIAILASTLSLVASVAYGQSYAESGQVLQTVRNMHAGESRVLYFGAQVVQVRVLGERVAGENVVCKTYEALVPGQLSGGSREECFTMTIASAPPAVYYPPPLPIYYPPRPVYYPYPQPPVVHFPQYPGVTITLPRVITIGGSRHEHRRGHDRHSGPHRSH